MSFLDKPAPIPFVCQSAFGAVRAIGALQSLPETHLKISPRSFHLQYRLDPIGRRTLWKRSLFQRKDALHMFLSAQPGIRREYSEHRAAAIMPSTVFLTHLSLKSQRAVSRFVMKALTGVQDHHKFGVGQSSLESNPHTVSEARLPQKMKFQDTDRARETV